jgi:hypothetical protein
MFSGEKVAEGRMRVVLRVMHDPSPGAARHPLPTFVGRGALEMVTSSRQNRQVTPKLGSMLPSDSVTGSAAT